MLPEVLEYFKTRTDSNEYYEAHRAVINANPVPMWDRNWDAEKRAEFYKAEETRTLAVLKFEQEAKEASITALEKLQNSDDPMIAWLCKDRVIARDYTSYRDAVLRALPMTREEIDGFGDVQGWCGDYARMLDRAERAGVLPAPEPPIADIDALVNELTEWYGGGRRRFASTIKKHLPAIVADANKRAEEARKAAEVKAVVETLLTKGENGTDTGTNGNVKPATTPTGRTHTPNRDSNGRFAPLSVSA